MVVAGRTQSPPAVDLSQVNLEDLMNIKITSVSKKEQKLSQTAAAIFVITQEDIHRSGALNIPDLLRMAPGVDVEQVTASSWAISVRGFNSGFSNKVLVQIDGRSLYSPIFSGVYWDTVDLPLEDIERIEIIRGPGATVWGANAVNGVISIITKHSKDTKGGLVVASGGSQVKAAETLQFGGTAGDLGTYRAFAKYSNIGDSGLPMGGAADDRWSNINTGFRSDWALSSSDTLMLQGSLIKAEEREARSTELVTSPSGPFVHEAVDQSTFDLLAQWTHKFRGGSETSLLAYYDNNRRTDFGVRNNVGTFNVDFQQHTTWGDRQDIVWGLGYRSDEMHVALGQGILFSSLSKATNLFSAFVQDEIRVSNSVWLTLGTKLEHNSYSGLEVEPSARLVWSPASGKHTLWAAVSKSFRQPSLEDAAVQANISTYPVAENLIAVARLFGNPHIKDEELRDYEVGYRADLTKKVSLDVSTFLSYYHHLETTEPLPVQPTFVPGSPSQLIVPFMFENLAHALTYGGEISMNWNPTGRWRISPGYSYLHAKLRADPSSAGNFTSSPITDFPQNMVEVRSLLNLGHKVEFDQSLYYTARLPGGSVPGHARLDFRVARMFGESTELSIVGQNLLRNRTLEYGNAIGLLGAQSLRSVYANVAWHFGQKLGR